MLARPNSCAKFNRSRNRNGRVHDTQTDVFNTFLWHKSHLLALAIKVHGRNCIRGCSI